MGFTRYWTRPRELDVERFASFATACAEVCSEYKDWITNEDFSSEQVRIEGKPGCEAFTIERVSSGREQDGDVFEFCKTQELPYDEAVERCLELFKSQFAEVAVHEPS